MKKLEQIRQELKEIKNKINGQISQKVEIHYKFIVKLN